MRNYETNRLVDRWLLDSAIWRYFISTTVTRELLPRISLPENAKVLDLGGGAGAAVPSLRRGLRGCKITVIDSDPKMIELARRRTWHHGDFVYIEQMNATKLLYDNHHFDAVLCCEALHHMPRWREILKEVWRVTKPGGVIMIAEALKGLVTLPIVKTVFPHPKEAHFTGDELIDGVYQAGFERPGDFVNHLGLQLVGVAKKA